MGSIMIPMMEEQGYDRAWSAALVSAGGILGMLIPPSNPFIIYCGITETPVGPMFLAGIVPGVLLILILYAVVLIMPEGRIRSKKKYTWKERGRILYEVIPLLGVPVVILGGIYGGIATPVEAAALACIYAAIIGCFVYRQLTWQGIIKALRTSVRTTSMIFVLVAMAYGVNAVATMLGVPTALASMALGFGKMGILLMVMGLMLFLGFMLEEISTMVVMVPIFWPSLLKLGVDPLQFGVVICTAAAIGYCTPPIALNLYTAASVANVSSTAVFRKVIPFLIGIVILNLITVFVPQVSTWLPYLVYHRNTVRENTSTGWQGKPEAIESSDRYVTQFRGNQEEMTVPFCDDESRRRETDRVVYDIQVARSRILTASGAKDSMRRLSSWIR